ncbi:MAG: hypothetical protein V4487_06190 [Chlamydiota bacterium]
MGTKEIEARTAFFTQINKQISDGNAVLIHTGSDGEKVMKTVEQFNTSCLEKICCIIPRAIRDICLFISCNCCGKKKYEYYRVVGTVQNSEVPREYSVTEQDLLNKSDQYSNLL